MPPKHLRPAPSSRERFGESPTQAKLLFSSFLVFLDAASILVGLGLGYILTFEEQSLPVFFAHQWKLIVYSESLYLGLAACLGGYRYAYVSPLRFQALALLKSYFGGTLLTFATLFLFRNTYYAPESLLSYLVLIPSLIIAERSGASALRRALHRRTWGFERLVVVLADADGNASVELMKAAECSLVSVAATVHLGKERFSQRATQRVYEAVHSSGATGVLFAGSSLEKTFDRDFIDNFVKEGLQVRLITPEVHDTLRRLGYYNFSGVLCGRLTTGESPIPDERPGVIEALLGLLLLVVSSPLLFSVALFVRIDSRGPVLFRQTRALSLRSGQVRVYKIRSMRAETRGSADDSSFLNGGGDLLFKSRDDPRVTRVGRWIRRSSLDELPSL